jgi:glutamate N-acetyltransferase/amino-acid N-acetyltransferase
MLVVMANGLAGNQPLTLESPYFTKFLEALEYVCIEMAKAIARDGEGATKLVEVQVRGAKTDQDAQKAAITVAKSSLVKTAVFGSDANWGRILAAVGYSGADFNPNVINLYLQDQPGELIEQMMAQGAPLVFNEQKAKRILDGKYIIIRVDLKQGTAQATAWGCDLTYEYVKINADYRT